LEVRTIDIYVCKEQVSGENENHSVVVPIPILNKKTVSKPELEIKPDDHHPSSSDEEEFNLYELDTLGLCKTPPQTPVHTPDRSPTCRRCMIMDTEDWMDPLQISVCMIDEITTVSSLSSE
jgi:hypothetical protein